MLKIAVCASAPSSRTLAPFGDPEWEIWCCSPPNYDLPRIDAWFELHSLKRKWVNAPSNKPYFDVLQTHPRVYMNGEDPLFPQFPLAIAYPFDEMLKEFGPWFMTSSVAWMLAFAIVQKPDKIGLWGVDMSAHEEYGYQRAGCHFFIQEAIRRGIALKVPPESDLMNPPPLYALKEQSPFFWKNAVRKAELEERIAKAENQIAQAKHERDVLGGAVDNMRYYENTYCPTRLGIQTPPIVPADVPIAEAPKLLIELAPEMLEIINDV
jgi:hypothetical protein